MARPEAAISPPSSSIAATSTRSAVDIFQVADGHATLIRYSPDLFTFDKVKPPSGDIGFAGFAFTIPLNRPNYFDEICAFLGASYFRAVAKGQGYGLSARGLAIKTADPAGEEFPLFTHILAGASRHGQRCDRGACAAGQPERRRRRSASPSGQASRRIFDTEMALYPRVDIATVGHRATDQHVPVRYQRSHTDRRLSRGGARFEWTGAADRAGRAGLASAGQPAGTTDQRLHRQQARVASG